ncbi:MAG TPA: DNA-binding protein [Anaerolineae bacterium]|nr:DNA-binding protein [Anaerolineae bacterium]
MINNEMLTPREVAEYLKVPIQTIWRWCRTGTLPAVKIGKYWRIPRNELEAFIKTSANRGPQAAQEAAWGESRPQQARGGTNG